MSTEHKSVVYRGIEYIPKQEILGDVREFAEKTLKEYSEREGIKGLKIKFGFPTSVIGKEITLSLSIVGIWEKVSKEEAKKLIRFNLAHELKHYKDGVRKLFWFVSFERSADKYAEKITGITLKEDEERFKTALRRFIEVLKSES